jgi:NAD(P)-dependent dehydrogenase (short-subunit alcohol dehydrogenase family)
MKKVIVITGASSGFGRLSANALAKAGHTVYASMRDTDGRNAPQVEAAAKFAKENDVDLRTIELDVASQSSADAAIQRIVSDNHHLDVVYTMLVTWSLVLLKHSRLNSSQSSTTLTCSARSG